MFLSFHHSPLFLVIWLATCSSFPSRLLVVHALAATAPRSPATAPLATSTAAPLRFFIGGFGYCGQRLADRLRLEFPDCHISGCVRSEDSKQRLLLALAASTTASSSSNHNDSGGMATNTIHVLDLDQDYQGLDVAGLADLQRATHLIQTIAPIADLDRDPLLALHSQTLQSASSSPLQWVGYLSSTGVYGDYGGDWVDEDSELKCRDAKSLARVRAEQEWRDLETTMRRQQQQESRIPLVRVDCFRCGGIYGPGRGPLATALARRLEQAGATLSCSALLPEDEDESSNSKTPPKYVNRILVDDICGAIVAAVKANNANNNGDDSQQSAASGSIYNLVDDDPAPRRHVVEEANRLVFATIPNEIKRQIPSSSSAISSSSSSSLTLGASSSPKIQTAVKRPTSRSTGNKRCKNQRLKDAFHWTLLAPSFREGLRICLESYDQSASR